MRLVDFLILLLQAHAQTLQRLAAIYGEEALVELLEQSADEEDGKHESLPPPRAVWSGRSTVRGIGPSGSAYAELETAVHELKLPPVLEFHLWAYPHYRAFIESSLELQSRIQGPDSEALLALADDSVEQARAWVRRLHVPPELAQQTERAAHVPWLRFRTTVLQRVGRRPLGTVT